MSDEADRPDLAALRRENERLRREVTRLRRRLAAAGRPRRPPESWHAVNLVLFVIAMIAVAVVVLSAMLW